MSQSVPGEEYLLLPVVLILRSADDYLSDGTIPDIADQHVYDPEYLGFSLAFQPNKERIQGHFLTNVFLKALPAGLTDVLMVGALVVFGKTFDVNTTDISTAATMLLLIVGFIILFNICKPVNIFRGVVWGGCLTGCILCIIFLPKLFAITGMSTKCIMLLGVFSIATGQYCDT